MNQTAKKLRKAADYMKDSVTTSADAIIQLCKKVGVERSGWIASDLGRVLEAIADELDELQARAAGAGDLRQRLESAEGKAERRKKHIGYLSTALHDKNALLKRRGEAIARVTAENAGLRKRVPSERERQILEMWPRFEDGELVMSGDKVHYSSAYNDETEIEVESITMMDGNFVLCDDECRSNQYEQGQRVKRPVQSVLDADGAETKKGDTVYLLKDGDKCRVTGFETIDGEVFARLHCDDRPEIEGARGSAITHRRRVLDADGVEIRVGDTVWHEDGSEWFVEEITRLGARCFDGDRRRTFIPAFLTHTPPDSWERLESDAVKGVCEYTGAEPTAFGAHDCDTCRFYGEHGKLICEQLMALDIVRRAKALAGVEAD